MKTVKENCSAGNKWPRKFTAQIEEGQIQSVLFAQLLAAPVSAGVRNRGGGRFGGCKAEAPEQMEFVSSSLAGGPQRKGYGSQRKIFRPSAPGARIFDEQRIGLQWTAAFSP